MTIVEWCTMGQDLLAVVLGGRGSPDSEISLKKASFELRKTLARAKGQVGCASATLHTYLVCLPAFHTSSVDPSISLFFY